MPIYKNQDTGTWYVICWYTHWTGERKQKCKRGFPTKKAASEWEREFLIKGKDVITSPKTKKSVRVIQMPNFLVDEIQDYLKQLYKQAQDMYDQLMYQMAIRAGITEQIKATDQMAWVQKMNAISNQVREIINAELIYA